MEDIVKMVWDANPGRKIKNLGRRMMKAGEEYGEALQAYLAVTSKNNKKQKSWADVREELTDTIIVNFDALMTRFPDEPKDITDEQIRARMVAEFTRKLNKWADKSDSQDVKDDAE
jgi:hypothetical protein